MYKIIVWGLGKEFHQSINILKYYTMLRQIEIVALTATSVPNVNMIDEYKVIKTEDIKNTEFDFVLIMSEKYFRNISQNLNSMGIDNAKILRGKILNIPNMDFKEYVKLKQSKLTIVSNTCWGGMLYATLGMECLSPFKNLYFYDTDYIKVLNNFKEYMDIEPQFQKFGSIGGRNYPILRIKDIDIHCNHDVDPDEAIEKWNRRRKKINYNNMLVEMSTSDRKIAEKFCDLKNYNKKVCLVPFEMNCKYAVKLEMLPEQKEFWQTANETAALGVDTYNFSIIDLCNGIIKHRYL